jgi:hypothetical protein
MEYVKLGNTGSGHALQPAGLGEIGARLVGVDRAL